MARNHLLQVRRDTAANWTSTNPTLAAGEPGFESDTGKLKIGDGTTAWTSLGYIGVATATGAGGFAVFGDGSDGSPTFDGTTTILGITPSPSSAVNGVYTLLRDLYLASPILNSGISIVTNGYRIFCSGTFTNNGTVKWNGTSVANSATAGVKISNATSTVNQATGNNSSPGCPGGAGGATTGSNGSNASTSSNSLGGAGGTGGTGTSGAGGSGGTCTPPIASWGSIRAMPQAVMGMFQPGIASTPPVGVQGGAGGGGGGGDTSNAGAGGAGGGGFVIVAAKTFAGTGAIQARGGNGGTRTTGNVGGGGGGGGGVVIVISASVVSGAVSGQTIDANGGTKGSPNGGGTDNATNGSNGTTIILPC